jgi:hypothetical protein
MVGKFNFLLRSRPDFGFALSNVNRFCMHFQKPHLDVVKHIYRYAKGTIDMGLLYCQGEDCVLSRFWMQIGLVTEMIGDQQPATLFF